MSIILLDNDFYEEILEDDYINKLVNFIDHFFDLDVSVFHPFCNVGNSWSKQNMLAVIQLKLQKIGKIELLDAELITPIENISYNSLNFSSDFIGEITYLLDKYINVIIPVTPNKHKCDVKKIGEHVYIVNHVLQELDSNISFFIRNNLFMQNIINPSLNNPLPNKEICEEYFLLQREMITSGYDTLNTYSKIAKEVAMRNRYIYNRNVSVKNKSKNSIKSKRREIYDYNKKQYVSTDFESGCFEVYNKNGIHQGESSYIGDLISPADNTGSHNIIV